MNESQLNEYSRRFTNFLFKTYPHWRDMASVDSAENVDEGSLLVTVWPYPRRDIEWPLRISTDGEEVTVGFDMYHAHFNRYSDDDEAEEFADALKLIEDLLLERIAVISWWHGDEWRGSSTIAAGTTVLSPTWTSNAKTARIRSWKGTHDQEIGA